MNDKPKKVNQKSKFPFCLSDDEMLNPIEVFYSFCDNSNLRTETHRLDRVLEAISKSGYESNRLCYELVDTEYRRLIEASFLLSDRKMMEEISIERFLGLFAHEIKTQLVGASMAVEALIEKKGAFFLSQPDFEFYLISLKSILFNSNQILSNMITTVHFKEDYFSLKTNIQPFNVSDFIDACTRPYHLMNESFKKHLVVEQNQLEGKTIFTDRIKLLQIIQNLLSNAYKHSTGNDIQLIATGFADYISFSVITMGQTISTEEIKHLFKMFYKVKPGGTGNGLGLYLCQLYTELLNGTIKITSNMGITSFTVSIPCEIKDTNIA
ncbi:sensor histidine kinase KdpD [Chitinophaga sp. CF418]|uniref:sensor histidine kinase n=1 Tax=Chitinophaga sp. CF418 TaxID=1855287 RepID=UPI000915BC58|nr:HAMP domain-containing sensor histidine kinase [Chitinophaga sp. CF418]SHN30729.1 Signal transduction histidine kinase [Chitinophaga sp. CF418]